MAKKILLVDDEQDMAAVTQRWLESEGFEVLTVGTGEDGLAYLQKETPDLVLIDLLLPKMRGEEVCKLLKADDKFKQLPVILFTASICDIHKVAKEVDADDYIMKPYEPEELLAKIKKFIK